MSKDGKIIRNYCTMKNNKKETLKENFAEAFKNYKKRDLKTAEILCYKILSIEPNHFDSTFLLATIFALDNNFDKAKKLLYKALEMQPKNVNVLNNLGTDLHYTGSGLTSQATSEEGISDFLNREASYDKLPSTYNMALSYNVAGAILGMTYTSHNFSYDELNMGAEYTLNDMFHLRAGMTMPQLEEDSANDGETLYSMNFGAGLKYSLYGVNLVVDYTMRNQSDAFNTSNVFSLGLVF